MFKTPIELLEKKNTISESTQNDLQLDVVYSDLFGPQKQTSRIRKIWQSTITTDTGYLKETQDILSRPLKEFPEDTGDATEKTRGILDKMRSNPSFKEKYEYITIKMFEKINHSEHILQIVSMFTLSSPIVTLVTPIIMIFIPFFILKAIGVPVTMENYIAELKTVLKMLPVGRLFHLDAASLEERGFILFTVILYFVNIYQNTLTCYRFYNNTQEMVNEIHHCGDYCKKSAESMEKYYMITKKYPTYKSFSKKLQTMAQTLRGMGKKFLDVRKETFRHIGKKMKVYYDLYCDKNHMEIFTFCFDYSEYISNIRSLVCVDSLNPCRFSKNKTTFSSSYYSLLRNSSPVKNSLSLSKNAVLSGPNASGKTTLLKSVVINIILSQQIGKGFYDKASVMPYNYLHCYINIPDNCDRDSLFQAEARRCKNILDIIRENPGANHLCVFDELFSGTNPYEAVACAYSYLDYTNQFKNVRYILTTHYLELCDKIEQTGKVANYTLENKYHLQKGISRVKGGIKVIKDLGFPEEIIKTADKMVS